MQEHNRHLGRPSSPWDVAQPAPQPETAEQQHERNVNRAIEASMQRLHMPVEITRQFIHAIRAGFVPNLRIVDGQGTSP